MRTTVAILSLTYGVIAFVLSTLATITCLHLSGQHDLGVFYPLAAPAGMAMMLASCCLGLGGVGMLGKKWWGLVVADLSSRAMIVSAFAFFFLLVFAEATEPGASLWLACFVAIVRSLATTAIPAFIYRWCRAHQHET